VNISHFRAIVRMRWQMARNQFRKSGKVNRVVTILFMVLAALGSLGSFVFAIGWGRLLLSKLAPVHMMYVWDVLGGVFLFAWAISLMVELQQSEMLSLKNLLHLPISLSGAFFLNYASSLVSFTILLFLPAMLGLCYASVMHFGAGSLVMFALLLAFLLMVTAVTYQLRGWLARLMENKRTRGTVIMVTTIVFVMIMQLPNMLNLGTFDTRGADYLELREARDQRVVELQEQLDEGQIDKDEHTQQIAANLEDYLKKEKLRSDARIAKINRQAMIVNASLPIGWLPYGASAAASGSILSPWLCVFGMSTIGFVSLAMAYRSTFRRYTGEHNKTFRPAAQKAPRAFSQGTMLVKSIPLLSETESAITMASLRSTLRAPEAKMALLTPLIFVCIFGSMMLTGKMEKMPEMIRPFFGIGAIGMSLLGMVQMMLNMFGLDRQGFRAYVLMPAPRRDILLGKNMGLFPLGALLTAALVLFMALLDGMNFTHVVATLLQIVIAFFIYFTFSNYTSIIAPIGIAVGTMKPTSMKFSVLLVQFIALLLVPVAILPATLALAAELLSREYGGIQGVPIYLLLTLIELPLAIWYYRKTPPGTRTTHPRNRLPSRRLIIRTRARDKVICFTLYTTHDGTLKLTAQLCPLKENESRGWHRQSAGDDVASV